MIKSNRSANAIRSNQFTGLMGWTRNTNRLIIVVATIDLVALAACAVAQSPSRNDPKIVVEYHGINRGYGGTVFSLSLFEDGTVIFDGRYRTRVSGEAHATVVSDKVQQWVNDLVSNGALARHDSVIPADSSWYRITVRSEGKEGSFRFNSWNRSSPTMRVVTDIFNETQVFERWVRNR